MSQDLFGSFPFSESSSTVGIPGTIGASGGGGSSDHKVQINAADTTPDYLAPKLVAGAGISLAVQNPGANENILISATGAAEDHKVAVSATDTTPNYLAPKLVAGAGATVSTLNPGANEQVQIVAVGDHKVLVDPSDTSAGFLGNKIIAGAGISVAVAFPGSNEAVQISATGAEDHKVAVSATDTTPNFLSPKLVAGTNVTLTTLNPGANEQIQIAASGGAVAGPFGQQSYDYTTANSDSAITRNGSPGTDASGTRAWAYIPNATATMNRMRIAIRNTGGSLLRLSLYDATGNRIAETAQFAPVSQSILSVVLMVPVSVTGGVVYYMAYWCNDTTGNLTFPVITGRSVSTANPLLQRSDPNDTPVSIGAGLTNTDIRNWLMASE